MRIAFISTTLLFLCTTVASQQNSYFDPAQAYNKLLIEKNDGTYTVVKNFKVIGSCYLFGQNNTGNIYGASESANELSLSYNTYNQEVEFSPKGSKTVLVKEPSTLDSFKINKNLAVLLEEDLLFIYGPLLGSKEKIYFQSLLKGKKVSLYKSYKAKLDLVTTNILQSELKQFDIDVEYFFTDSTGKNIKKLKVNSKALSKEFAYIKDISSIIDTDALTAEKDKELIRIFGELNKE